MKPSARKKPFIAKAFGYALLAVVVFLFGLWLFLPYGEIARRAETELSKRGIDARIEGLGPRTPLTYRIKSIHVTRAMGKELNLRLTDAAVSLSLGKILDGRVGVNVAGTFLGGEVVADAIVPDPDSATVSWKGIEFAPLTRLFSENEVPVNGLTAGTVRIALPYEGLTKLDANLESEFSNVSFGPYNTMGFTINPIALGNGRIKAEVQSGKVRVFESSLSGGDVSATVEGTVMLAQPLLYSRLDGIAEVKPSKQFENEYFMVMSLLSSFKNSAGGFSLNIGGTVASPTVRPR